MFVCLFVCLFLAALGLHCSARAFSSCGERGATLRCGAQASHCSGFSCCRARALGARAQWLWLAGSAVVARGLQSVGSVVVAHGLSCSTACGIFPDQGCQPLIYLSSLWICLLQTFQKNGIIQYVAFCVWLLSLSKILSRLIHVIACTSTLFVSMSE